MSRLDFFLLMFPPAHLADSVRLTNDELVRRRQTNPTKARSKAACGDRLKLVKGGGNEEGHEPDGQQDGATRMLHGTWESCIFYRLGIYAEGSICR